MGKNMNTMLKKDLLDNIVLFQCYLESKNNNKHIKNALKQFSKLFPNLANKERVRYWKYTQLLNQYPIE